jgi:uncharacterized protein (UPF0264 family)
VGGEPDGAGNVRFHHARVIRDAVQDVLGVRDVPKAGGESE